MGKKNSLKHEENGVVNSIIEETEGDPKKVDKKSKKILSAKTYQEEIVSGLQTLILEETEVETKEIISEEKEQGKKEKKSKMSSQRDEDGDSDEGFRPAIGGGFAALMGDDDDYGDDDEGEEEKVVVEKKNKEGKEKKEQPKDKKVIVNIKDKQPEREKNKKEKGKKSKGKRRGNDEDDDDIDQLLAEIESEYTGVKKEVKLNEDLPKEIQNKDAVKKEPKEIVLLKELKLEEKEKANEDPKNMDNNNKKKDKVEPVTQNDIKKEETKIETKKTEPKKKLKNGKNTEDDKPKEESNELEVSQKEKKESKQKESKKEEKEKTPVEGSNIAEEVGKKKKKSKTKEDKKREEEESKTRKGPNKKMLAAIQEHIAKQKEEAERLRKEEEERERIEEERIRKLEEEKRLEEERKERQRIKQKERIKRLKEEGKILTPKQKLEQKRAQAMLEYLKMQGVAIPEAGEKLASQSIKRSKRRKQEEVKEEPKEELHEEKVCEEKLEVEEEKESWEGEEEGVVDTWDQISDESGDEADVAAENRTMNKHKEETKAKENDSCEDEESGNEEHQTEADKRREKAKARMEQRRIDNEKNKSEKKLRAPVVCVLGHVDHGKTKILDKLRRTNVQEGEVGGITQQIGATNVPFDAIRSQTRMVKDFEVDITNLPGLLIIDTPGHESFTNLRTRGSSLCDIAILVVDITQGLEPQTIESINLLRSKKTPFVVALNKVDRVFEWESHPSKDIQESIKLQNDPSKNDFERRTKEIIQALNVQGLNAALFWENPDARSYVSLVPTSAISGDGMGNLMALTCTMCQKRLSHRLMFSEQLQCTVLEVKTIQGHGTTIDVILVNGSLKEGDTMILAGTEGPIVTQIRSLLLPKPMKEIRVKGQYDELKVVEAALGVKIAARDLEKAIAGLNLQVAVHEDEIELLKEEVDREFKAAMRSMKVKDKGVYVQASTLGALEALLEFFKANKVPYAGIRVGPVVKRDVMKAAAMLEHDPMYAVILAFDVKVERDAQELADKEGVKIFSEETIYHLGDRYVDYIKDYKKKKQDEFRHIAVFPSKLKIIPSAIFNKRDPIVLGVSVEAGILRTGTPICVPSKEFVEIGVVTSLEFDHKVVEIAKKGVSVCMKVEPLPGHTPKLFGRHFDVDDILVSKISRESIDACKQYFRDDLGKTEWKLMAELKKQFNIL